MNKFERFCTKHSTWGIPRLPLLLAAGMAAFTIAILVGGNTALSVLFYHPLLVIEGDWWRLLFFFFAPPNLGGSVITVLLFNAISIFFYYWISNTLEQLWGRFKFNLYFFGGCLLTLAYSFIFSNVFPVTAITNSYVLLSCLLAFAMYNPDAQIRLYMIIPIKMKWFAVFSLIFFLLPIIQPLFGNGSYSAASFLPLIALLNFVIFFASDLLRMLGRGRQTVQYRRNTTIPFQETVRKSRERKGYLHKCTVCGMTDVDNPDMEFRYCSLCSGYQCYCSQHVFDHTHM